MTIVHAISENNFLKLDRKSADYWVFVALGVGGPGQERIGSTPFRPQRAEACVHAAKTFVISG